MKTVQEFMDAMNEYFDGTKNKAVAMLIAQEIRYVKPGDLDALFRQLTISLPAGWKPDIKSVVEAIRYLKLDTLTDPASSRTCPVCGTEIHSTGLCPSCCYSPETDGTPEQHRAWFERWKAGLEPHYDVKGILSGLESKTIKTFDEQ